MLNLQRKKMRKVSFVLKLRLLIRDEAPYFSEAPCFSLISAQPIGNSSPDARVEQLNSDATFSLSKCEHFHSALNDVYAGSSLTVAGIFPSLVPIILSRYDPITSHFRSTSLLAI